MGGWTWILHGGAVLLTSSPSDRVPDPLERASELSQRAPGAEQEPGG